MQDWPHQNHPNNCISPAPPDVTEQKEGPAVGTKLFEKPASWEQMQQILSKNQVQVGCAGGAERCHPPEVLAPAEN